MGDEVKFHTDRAMAELRLASQCIDREAAEAHLRRSARHLDRVRALSGAGASAPSPVEAEA